MSTARHVGRILSAWGLPAAVVLALVAVYGRHSFVSQTANQLVYDPFVRLDSKVSLVPAHVLLVYADADLDRQPQAYWQLLRRLRGLGASGLGIVELDIRRWSAEQVAKLSQWQGLVVGHLVEPETALAPSLTRSSIALTFPHDGIYRHSLGLHAADGLGSLAARVAQAFGDSSESVPIYPYGVRFIGPAESLPHVSAETVLRGEVTAALVRDRVVLIGRSPSPALPGLATPTTARRLMSALEFHGHALNTLLATRPITTMPVRMQWPLYLVGAILFPAIGRRMGFNLAVPLLIAAWTLQALATWLILWRFQMWVPLASLMFVEATAGLWTFDQRLRFSDRAWQLLRRRGFSVSPRFRNPPSLHVDEVPWSYITTMLQQLFPLDQVALLLARPMRDRLEVALCSSEPVPGAINGHRDLKSRPFDEAIRRRCAVRIDRDRPFFKNLDGQTQYFVPLFHAGQFQGALVVELSTTSHDKLPGFSRQLARIGDEIACWMARYDKLATVDRRHRRWWSRWVTPPEAVTFARLKTQLHSIERRLHQADQVVEQGSFGKAVFDLSGAVVTMNVTMHRLLHVCETAPAGVRLLEVVRCLTRRDMAECREVIRRVVFEQQRERIVVMDPTSDEPMALIVQPVLRPDQLANDPTEMQAFNVQAIHVEVFQGELLGDTHEVREHVTEQSLAAVHDTLSDVSALMVQLRAAAAPQVWHQVVATVDRARGTVQRCQSMLANDQSEDVDVRLPVEVGAMVRAAVTQTRPFADQRGTSVSASIPRDLPDVVANPHRLRQVVASAVDVMVEHSRDNSLINVTARTQSDQVTITIDNEGCGVTLDRLTHGRRSIATQTPSDVSRLLAFRQWLLVWGGDLHVDSELGEGASIRLILKHFDWSSSMATDTDTASPSRSPL